MSMSTSIQPNRQRFARYNASLHQRKKLMHVHLSRELRAKLGVGRRAVLLHKGDKVRLRNGDDKGKTGTVMIVNYGKLVAYVEGIVHKNARGVDKLRALQPANLEIIEGDFATKSRAAIIARGKKKTIAVKAGKPASAPSAPAAPAKQ
ncbi:MAG: 50S ribosomal protein L24 [Candidatus Micrarchaeota archaeon]|nr:50S ribosomal protein L24 [Candidatus Micrarchaeota archaeon]